MKSSVYFLTVPKNHPWSIFIFFFAAEHCSNQLINLTAVHISSLEVDFPTHLTRQLSVLRVLKDRFLNRLVGISKFNKWTQFHHEDDAE